VHESDRRQTDHATITFVAIGGIIAALRVVSDSER